MQGLETVKSLIPPLTVLCLLLTGCHSYESRTYDVTVHNRTPEPITIWLTKDGPPYEADCLSPEDLAIESPRQNETREIGGVILQPGKSASALRNGRFETATRAILRVYDGAVRFNDLLAISRDNPARVDVPLKPGKSEYSVEPGAGQLTVRRVEPLIHAVCSRHATISSGSEPSVSRRHIRRSISRRCCSCRAGESSGCRC